MRSFSILGDSISTFDGCNPDGFTVYYQGERCEQTGVTSSADTWWSQVIERLGGRLLANSSFSGSLVEGAGFPPETVKNASTRWPKTACSPMSSSCSWASTITAGAARRAQAAGRGNAVPVALDLDAIEPHAPAPPRPGAIDRFRAAYGLLLERMARSLPASRGMVLHALPRTRGRMPEPHVRMELARRTVQELQRRHSRCCARARLQRGRPRGVRHRLRGRRRHPPHRTGNAPAVRFDRVVHRRCRTR